MGGLSFHLHFIITNIVDYGPLAERYTVEIVPRCFSVRFVAGLSVVL